jgi:hypothetical protein
MWIISAIALAVALLPTSSWPTEPAPRPYVVAFEIGLVNSPDHLTSGSTWAPPEYAGVALDARVLAHLHLDGQAGLNFVEGWMGSVSARLATEVSRLTISIGGGPLVASGVSWSGPPVPYAAADASALLHFECSLVLMFRAGAAWALSNRGSANCGVDTCDHYVARGDRITFARIGIGSSF